MLVTEQYFIVFTNNIDRITSVSLLFWTLYMISKLKSSSWKNKIKIYFFQVRIDTNKYILENHNIYWGILVNILFNKI